jgi:hypothetical protein
MKAKKGAPHVVNLNAYESGLLDEVAEKRMADLKQKMGFKEIVSEAIRLYHEKICGETYSDEFHELIQRRTEGLPDYVKFDAREFGELLDKPNFAVGFLAKRFICALVTGDGSMSKKAAELLDESMRCKEEWMQKREFAKQKELGYPAQKAEECDPEDEYPGY